MSLQASRGRLHAERARMAVRGARCAVCHVLIRETPTGCYWIDRHRHTRLCEACAGTEEV